MPKEELKSKRGITLVALVVTIVIMLILVGVTVSQALHGGLFGTTKQATKKYNIEALKEEVETSYTLYNQNKKNKKTLKEYFMEDLGIEEDKIIEYKVADAVAFWYKEHPIVIDNNEHRIVSIGGEIVTSDKYGDIYDDLLNEGKYVYFTKQCVDYYNWGKAKPYRENIITAFFDVNITTTAVRSFLGASSLENLYLNDGLLSIKSLFVRDCTNLKRVVLPSSVTCLEDSAFQTSGLVSITIPPSISSFGSRIFNGCNSLITVCLNDSISYIPGGFVYGCAKLENIYIPKSVTRIEGEAFYNSGLKKVYYGGASLEEWNNIQVDRANQPLSNAKKYWYSEKKPQEEGNFWHWVGEEMIEW